MWGGQPEGQVSDRGAHGKERLGGGIVVLVLVVLLAGAAAFGAHGWKRDLRVRIVAVRGNRVVPAADVVKLASIWKDQKLFDVDLAGAQQRVLANPYIGAASVTRDVPDRITITVTERVPIAAVALDNILYLDAEGHVLPAVRSEQTFDLPVLTGALPAAECVPGGRVSDASVLESIGVLATAKQLSEELYHRISEVHIDGSKNIVLTMADFGVPVLYGRGNAADKLLRLDGFWNEFVSRRGPNELKYVDLRFDDQVVVRWHQPGETAVQ